MKFIQYPSRKAVNENHYQSISLSPSSIFRRQFHPSVMFP